MRLGLLGLKMALVGTFCTIPSAYTLAEEQTSSAMNSDPSNIPAECSNPKPDTCTFYRTCLEPRVHCGAKGYPLGYGEKFCNAFMADKREFSEKGQKWLDDVGTCLQKSLVSLATGPESEELSCTKLRDFAFSTHTKCYIETGFCAQSFTDQLTLLSIVGFTPLFTDVASIKSTLAVLSHCVKVDLGITKGTSSGSHVDL